MKKMELLSPAKNFEYGKAAIDHGADAVYIGSQNFGARAAASNKISEIENLVSYAHKFNSKVYIAFNTILFDQELKKAQKEIHDLWNIGADALIIQDMGILEIDIPKIPLFASTQTDNQEPERIKFLEDCGFERVILARELSLDQIKGIRKNTSVDLEAFVHGALCVSYSGRCYLSAYIGSRSANRGSCGQPCRLKWDLVTQDNEIIVQNKHLLSLKDMDRSKYLNQLIDAGITSFKIEGRLKDLSYLKNITALYRKNLDLILENKPDFIKASSGKTKFFFTPDPKKTFTRGETDYFLNGKRGEIHSFNTPKSLGENIGVIKSIDQKFFTLKSRAKINNGDGLCYFDKKEILRGLGVNRVENEKIYTSSKTDIRKSPLYKGAKIYRNFDHAFLKKLSSNSSSIRKVGLNLKFMENKKGFTLIGEDEDKNTATIFLETNKIKAEKQDKALDTIKKQISKLGDSIFHLNHIKIESKAYFLRAQELNKLRRELLCELEKLRVSSYKKVIKKTDEKPVSFPLKEIDYSYNVSNRLAKKFYKKHGVKKIEDAFEIKKTDNNRVVMTTKYCIKHSIGLCIKKTKKYSNKRLFLINEKDRIELVFDCNKCEMKLLIP